MLLQYYGITLLSVEDSSGPNSKYLWTQLGKDLLNDDIYHGCFTTVQIVKYLNNIVITVLLK